MTSMADPGGPAGRLGPLLRERRLACGLSYAEVSETTKIQPYILEALEEERWESLPPEAFMAGFIRTYARVLGLDATHVLGLYRGPRPAPAPAPRPLRTTSTAKRRPGLWVSLLALGAILLTGHLLWRFLFDPQVTEEVLISSVPNEASLPQAPQVPETAPGEEAPAVAAPSPVPAAPVPSPGEKAAPSSAPSTLEVPSPSPPRTDLLLRATVRQKTWVRIWVDDQKPTESLLLPGTVQEWKAREAFELVIGNAGGLTLELNGRPMKELGKSGKVIRLRLPDDFVIQEHVS